MKLVVDTNILLAALIKNSTTRSIILNSDHNFLVPEFALEEVTRKFPLISFKSGLAVNEIKFLFDVIALGLRIVPLQEFRERFYEAEKEMGDIDKNDVPFLALALNVDCDGIWSNDLHFRQQKLIKVWNTRELVKILH